eukprot:1971870-Rhodomonas_salina.1
MCPYLCPLISELKMIGRRSTSALCGVGGSGRQTLSQHALWHISEPSFAGLRTREPWGGEGSTNGKATLKGGKNKNAEEKRQPDRRENWD